MSEIAEDERYQFALLDLGRAAPLRERVLRLPKEAAVSLYGDDASLIEKAYGPYLIWRNLVSRTWMQWMRDGWLQDWGMEIHAQCTLPELRRHLKKFNFVRHTGSKTDYLFGYYHPEVMRHWFSVANRAQLATFFSEIDYLICPLPQEPWAWRVDRPDALPPPARLPLIFDEDQLDGFATQRTEDFKRRAMSFARRHIPEVSEYTDDMLQRALMATQQQAGMIGIVSEQHLMVLYLISLRRKANVFADPDTVPILQDQMLAADTRVQLLADRYL